MPNDSSSSGSQGNSGPGGPSSAPSSASGSPSSSSRSTPSGSGSGSPSSGSGSGSPSSGSGSGSPQSAGSGSGPASGSVSSSGHSTSSGTSSSSSSVPPKTPCWCCEDGDNILELEKCNTCPSPDNTEDPVRYANGQIFLTAQDLWFNGFGRPWGHSRSFDNIQPDGEPYNGVNGVNWYINHAPYLSFEDYDDDHKPRQIALRSSAAVTLLFYRIGSTAIYRTVFGEKGTLRFEEAANHWVYMDSKGQEILFAANASFKGLIDANGDIAQAGYTAGRLTSLLRVLNGKQTGFIYDYQTAFPGKLLSVTLKVQGQDCRRVSYTYYGLVDDNGLIGDLKTAKIEEFVEDEWVEIRTSYYRYYTTDSSIGFKHGLKFVVNGEAYARLAEDHNPENASDSTVGQYADYYFEYIGRVVKLEKTKGGLYTYQFAYSGNPNSGDRIWDFNQWTRKTIETLPDGNQTIAYSNSYLQVICKIFKAGASQWVNAWKLDSLGKRIKMAEASAVQSVDESSPGVAVWKTNGGLVRCWDYYLENDPSGQPAGYLRRTRLQEGSEGQAVLLKSFEYTVRTVNSRSIFPLSSQTVYQKDDGTEPATTTYTYDEWYPSSFQPKQRTTIWPVVPSGQNGSNEATSRTEVFDRYGNVDWLRDEREFLTAFSNDPATRALIWRIDDVDTSVLPAPNDWDTPTGGGLHLVTDYEYDVFGRHTQTLGPEHEIDLDVAGPTTVRRAKWTVYKDSAHTEWEGTGYAVNAADPSDPPDYNYTLIEPVSIHWVDRANRTIAEIESKRTTGSGRLDSWNTFDQADWTRWAKTNYDDNSRLTSRQQYHAIAASGPGVVGTNYGETTFSYDLRGRQVRQKTPGGTIAWRVFNPRGSEQELWVGTDETGATLSNPGAGGANGNNMARIAERAYDGGTAGGDGNLTQLKLYATPSDVRTTVFTYDFRNRRTIIDGEIDLYAVSFYDNLDRVTKIERRDTNGAGSLLTKSETHFDNRGRVYETLRYAVNAGVVGNALSALTWYDASGNVIKQRSQAGAGGFEKQIYDGLRRVTCRYVACDPNAESYSQASSVSDDIVLEQTELDYDAAGNVIEQRIFERNHDATGTGELAPSSEASQPPPHARVSYQAFYPDALGRQVAVANYGTNGGVAIDRPPAVPPFWNVWLVTVKVYNAAGDLCETVDPQETVNRHEYDKAGRLTATVENYHESTSGSDINKRTEFNYNLDGKLIMLTAFNDITDPQITQWIYGTARTEVGIASFELLRAKIYPDSDDVADPLGNGSDGIYDRVEYQYNQLGQLIGQVDQNGTVHSYDYDKIGRLLHDRITTLGSGVAGDVRRISRTYDARGSVTAVTSFADADPQGTNVVNQVQFDYNGFRQLMTEYQAHSGAVAMDATPTVNYGFADGTGNSVRLLGIAYPNGRSLSFDYGSVGSVDFLRGRIREIKEGGQVWARYTHRGTEATVRIEYPEPGVEMTYIKQGTEQTTDAGDQYTGLDRFGRIIDIRWLKTTTGSHVDRFQYGFDRASNRTYRKDPTAPNNDWDEKYEYDGLYQLANFERGHLTSTAPPAMTTPLPWQENFDYDPTGNWQGYETRVDGATTLDQGRSHDPANEITAINNPSGNVAYDKAGNMTTMPSVTDWNTSLTATWDAWNRLVKISQGSTILGEYQYDGLTRRTSKKTTENNLSVTRHFYYSNQWQVLEERLGSAMQVAERQFIWGLRYIDDLVLRDCFAQASSSASAFSSSASASASSGSATSRLYATHDQWHVTALLGTGGTVQERYAYDTFGASTVLSASFTARTASLYDWETRYGAYRFDPEANLYCVRYRYLHPKLGRWLSRDPLREKEGTNLYAYVKNQTANGADPSGLATVTATDGFDSANFTFAARCGVIDVLAFVDADLKKSLKQNDVDLAAQSDPLIYEKLEAAPIPTVNLGRINNPGYVGGGIIATFTPTSSNNMPDCCCVSYYWKNIDTDYIDTEEPTQSGTTFSDFTGSEYWTPNADSTENFRLDLCCTTKSGKRILVKSIVWFRRVQIKKAISATVTITLDAS